MTNDEVILNELEQLRSMVIDEHIRKGQVASGKTKADEIIVFKRDTAYVLSIPIDLEQGRGPGRGRPMALFGRIYDWLQYRKYGLTYDDDKERRSLAAAIAIKIHKKGTYLHEKNIKSGVISDNITEQAIQDIGAKLLDNSLNIFVNEIDNIWR